MTADALERIGLVAIGRNEGERLKRCLQSVAALLPRVVYVDSGSTDGSVEAATAAGAEVVRLDPDRQFTAARARNAGFARLTALWPNLDYVMFIDGDCEFAPGFADAAMAVFEGESKVAIIAGRVREKNRDATVYNRLCDYEWDHPAGEATATGGNFMIRRAVFEAAKGFDASVIAAEDDEFCIRVRALGWSIRRIRETMCLHDAGMTRFGQWWRRAVRAGHAYAQVGAIHRGYFAAQRGRALFWGFMLPLVAFGAAPFTTGASLLLLLLYPASCLRNRNRLVRNGAKRDEAGTVAAFLTLSKFPNLLGMADYWRKSLFARRVEIIEYK